MRWCQEVLARVGVHGASLTATVSRIAEISLWSKHTSTREYWSRTQVSLQTWLYTPLFALPVTQPYTTRPKHTHKHFTHDFLH